MLELKLGKYVLFAVTAEEVSGKSVKIAIDLKKVTFEGEQTYKALDLINVLNGKFDKQKADKKTFNYLLNMAGVNFRSTDAISKKLITASGRKVFNVNLKYDFTPYDVVFSNDGIPATIGEILDYGQEKFAVCKLQNGTEKDVIVLVDDTATVGQDVKLHVNPYTLGIVDADRDIRVV